MDHPARFQAWLMAKSAWWRVALAAGAGAIAALGQAPFDLWILSIPAFALGLWVIALPARPRLAAGAAWAMGMGYFAIALHWIMEPFLVDAARFGWMAPFALVLMAGGMAVFWAGSVAIAMRFGPARGRGFAVALAITFAEYLRASVLTGFPWAHPGHVLIASEWVILGAWGGAHGLSLLVMGGAAALAWAIGQGRMIWAGAGFALFGVLGVLPLTPVAPPTPDTAPIMRLVQPNAPQHLKWQRDWMGVFFNRALQATSAPTADGRAPDLTIWPETSLPELLDQSEFSRADIGRAAQGPVAVGALRRIDGTVHNSLALLDDQGAILAVYDKHHLVPFGEYLPFENMLNRMGLQALAANLPGGMRPGPGPVVMDLPNGLGRVFPMICYEAIFARYIAQTNRPDWMMHITNDAWFGDFSGPYQHLALSRLRAVEHGLPVLRAANTGISAVIDARGRVVDALGLGQAGFVDAPLPVAIAPTIYARLGDWPVLGLWVVLCVLVFLRPMQKPPLRRPA